MVRAFDATQFAISAEQKNRLDRFKADHKEQILKHCKKTRRLVSNDNVIQYLLDTTTKK